MKLKSGELNTNKWGVKTGLETKRFKKDRKEPGQLPGHHVQVTTG